MDIQELAGKVDVLQSKFEDVKEDINHLKENDKLLFERDNEKQKAMGELTSTVKLLNQLVGQLEATVKNLTGRLDISLEKLSAEVKEINNIPKQRYNNLINYIISGVVGAILGFIAIQIGLK